VIKRKRNKKKRILFKAGSFRSKKSKSSSLGPGLIRLLKISFIALFVIAIGIFLIFAEKYVRTTNPTGTGPVVFVNVPEWIGEQLKSKILAYAGGRTFQLDEQAAQLVQENLSASAWLSENKAITTDKEIQVYATFRKPVALVKSGLSPFYVDAEQVVLDYVPMPHLMIVEIKGLSPLQKMPRYGDLWNSKDLAAAIKLLNRINRMDKEITPTKPLLREIASIDVDNYNGRKNRSRPHIILFTKDNTEIQWGAELGTWQKYLESTDEDKLAKLYGYYQAYNTLSAGAKYINLRDPRDNIPLPIDRY
jgi:hypothetical protein